MLHLHGLRCNEVVSVEGAWHGYQGNVANKGDLLSVRGPAEGPRKAIISSIPQHVIIVRTC